MDIGVAEIATALEGTLSALLGIRLVEATKERRWEELMPRMAEYMQDSFDYEAEDEFVRGLLKAD